MSDKQEQEVPFRTLGSRLRRLRNTAKESLAEVAGAVEIDPQVLDTFENGGERPSEDILELLISHFSLQSLEAEKLWKLAGYEAAPEIIPEIDADCPSPTIVVVPVDSRVTYTDLSQVAANEHGVVVNFMQTSGTDAKPTVISRVGMSKEQAVALVQQLATSLRDMEPKALPLKASKKTK